MDVINCPRCGRLFKKIVSPVCHSCEKLDDEQFKKLRVYLDEEPLANITEVSDATGVTPKRILQYIREGRLQIPEGLMGELRCSQCDAPIIEGNLCDSCAKNLANELSSSLSSGKGASNKSAAKKGGGMHIGARK